jgi:glycine betaine catabolism B
MLTFAAPKGETGAMGKYGHHFSYSSSPGEEVLEFTTRLRGSEFKNALDSLPLGAEVEWQGPFGSFVMVPGTDRAAFLTGGIGITCVRSMLRGMAGGAERPREMVLLFANRSDDAIPFRDELDDLAEKLPGLRVAHVISRPGAGWTGYAGHIDAEMLRREVVTPEGRTFYVSGPPTMSQAMNDLLLGWGARRDAVKLEKFDGYELGLTKKWGGAPPWCGAPPCCRLEPAGGLEELLSL